MAVIVLDTPSEPWPRHPRARIQAYAVRAVIQGAQSAIEDDMDEDGQLACLGGCDHNSLCPDHEAACTLAQKIIDWMDENYAEVLIKVEVPEPDLTAEVERLNEPPY